jgi:hypothetical protein
MVTAMATTVMVTATTVTTAITAITVNTTSGTQHGAGNKPAPLSSRPTPCRRGSTPGAASKTHV